MKKLATLIAVIVFAMLFSMNANATLLHDYFGITLQVGTWNGHPNQFINGWTPIKGTGVHDNWMPDGQAPDPGPQYVASELFDIEAMYTDVNLVDQKLYYSILTSMPNTGTTVSWWGSYVFRPGDVIFDFGSTQYAVETAFGGTPGDLYANPEMGYFDAGRGFGTRGNPEIDYANLSSPAVASTPFSYTSLGIMENGYDTYLIEGNIDLVNFSGVYYGTMTFAMSCNNDILNCSVVPEPTTVVLMGIGLIGLYARSRRKK
jgi:hypothetical protein